METKTLSQKVFEIVGDDPDSFDEAKELQVMELLTPVNHETDVNKVKWRASRSTW